MKKPLVSVVMSIHNGENFISRTIESIVAQTYTNLEIIIIDDYSSDNSRKVVEEFEDPRIRKIWMDKNYNYCYSANVGFRNAKGKYIAIIGHDDVWEKDKIEKQVQYMEQHLETVVCFTRVDVIDENDVIVNEKWNVFVDLFSCKNRSKEEWQYRLLFGNTLCAPSALIRKDLIDSTGGYRYGLIQLQDHELWMRLLKYGNIYILEEKLTKYRRFNNLTTNLSNNTVEASNRTFHETNSIIYDYILDLTNEEFVNIFNPHIKNLDYNNNAQIECEKAMVLNALNNCFAYRYFIKILESDECREYLEKKYSFYLNDFYKMNGKTIKCDESLSNMIKIQNQIIEKYKLITNK